MSANKLLSERVFIANSRVVITKDAHKQMCCNKCQEYGYIHNQCPNNKRCTTCTRSHPSASCTHPNEHHCVSCGASSNHARSDRGNCPQLKKHLAALDAHSPENTLPCFPVLGSPWIFILAVRNPQSTAISSNQQPRLPPSIIRYE